MELLNSEIEPRIEILPDKRIVSDENDIGIMKFGENNDYPQIVEKLILGSVDACAIANMYASFITGNGFKAPINDIVVGKDGRGNSITVRSLLRAFAHSAKMYNGGYFHINYTLKDINNPRIASIKPIPFKNCRLGIPDDVKYSGKVAVYENWAKDPKVKFDKTKVRFYPVFSDSDEVFKAQVKEVNGIDKHKGQVYFLFLDDNYFYPLSPFDPVLLDCDTQAEISRFKNNQIRNGFTDKTIVRIAGTDDAVEILNKEVVNMMGSRGNNCMTIRDELDTTTGRIAKDGGDIVVEKIPTNINDKLFESWEASLANNLRKANGACPKILIDYDSSNLGTTSGEAITQAVNFYNAKTQSDRDMISQMFSQILKKFDNEVLANNTDWTIEPLTLTTITNGINTNTSTAAGQ